MSQFDPINFLDDTTTEVATRRPPLSTDIDYQGEIGEGTPRSNPGRDDPSKTYHFMDMLIKLTMPPQEASRVGQPFVSVRHSVSLDVNPETGKLDWSVGKNNGLRMLREATGLNDGRAFNPRMLQGRMVKVKIKHVEYPAGSGEFQDNVKSVAKP